MRTQTPIATRRVEGHQEKRNRIFCIICSRPVPALGTFCPSCGALRASGGPGAPDAAKAVTCSRNEDVTFTLTLLQRRDGTRPFDLTNGSSLGSFSVAGTGLIGAGSYSDNEIFLDDVTVAKHHAEFVVRGGKCSLRDLRSVNGTFVNGVRVEETSLLSGDEIQIGRFKLLYLALYRAGVGPRRPNTRATAA